MYTGHTCLALRHTSMKGSDLMMWVWSFFLSISTRTFPSNKTCWYRCLVRVNWTSRSLMAAPLNVNSSKSRYKQHKEILKLHLYTKQTTPTSICITGVSSTASLSLSLWINLCSVEGDDEEWTGWTEKVPEGWPLLPASPTTNSLIELSWTGSWWAQ